MQLKILLIHCSYRYYGGEDSVFFKEREGLIAQLPENSVFEYHVRTPAIAPWRLVLQLLFPFRHTRRIKKLIRDHNINLVHVHNFFPLLTLSVFKAARQPGVVVVQTLHNYRWWCTGAELYRKEYGICELCVSSGHSLHAIRHGCYRNSRVQSLLSLWVLSRVKQRVFAGYVDYFIALTSFQKNWVEARGVSAQQLVVKPNGVAAISHCAPSDKKGFVYVGRLESSKGIEQVLRCWVEQGIKEPLTVIGNGSLESTLKKQYSHYPQLIFKGACSPQETLSLIDRARYLIHSSLWYETFGLTIVEALQLGVPVIGFAIGTRVELINDGVTGFLCQPETLGETLLKAISYQPYAELSTNARQAGLQFSAEKLLLEQLQLYRQWVSEKKGQPL